MTSDKAIECIRKLQKLELKLTEAELLQLVNLVPTTEIEIHLVLAVIFIFLLFSCKIIHSSFNFFLFDIPVKSQI